MHIDTQHADYDPARVPNEVTIPGNASRMCFTSDSVIDDDTPLEPDETFVLEVDETDPDDPRITVTDGNTTVIILDDDCEFRYFRRVHTGAPQLEYGLIVSLYLYL
jgi:hypothetical protein